MGNRRILQKGNEEPVNKLNLRKTPRVNGIRNEKLEYAGEVMVDMLTRLCLVVWKIGAAVSDDWAQPIIVPIGRGSREACKNDWGISLLSIPGKVYGRILRIGEGGNKIVDKSSRLYGK